MPSPSSVQQTPEERREEMFPQIAWYAQPVMGVPQFSKQHRTRGAEGIGQNHALCGARIRWMHMTPGDSRRCQRCDERAMSLVLRDLSEDHHGE